MINVIIISINTLLFTLGLTKTVDQIKIGICIVIMTSAYLISKKLVQTYNDNKTIYISVLSYISALLLILKLNNLIVLCITLITIIAAITIIIKLLTTIKITENNQIKENYEKIPKNKNKRQTNISFWLCLICILLIIFNIDKIIAFILFLKLF